MDFLQHFQLLVDVAANGLLPAAIINTPAANKNSTQWLAPLQSSPSLLTMEALSSHLLPTVEALEQPLVTAATARTSSKLSKEESNLLQEFADVLNAEGRLPPSTHGVEHHIMTVSQPVTAKFCRLDNTKLAAAKEEFHRLEQEGIICCSNSNWASPLHMVQKADRSW